MGISPPVALDKQTIVDVTNQKARTAFVRFRGSLAGARGVRWSCLEIRFMRNHMVKRSRGRTVDSAARVTGSGMRHGTWS
jgi:hypothetical protein